MVTSVSNYSSVLPKEEKKSSMPTLDQSDFLKLLTTQMTTQDPTDPVDNKEMIAQMASFSSLAGIAEMGDTLKQILAKLDAMSINGTEETPAETDNTGTDNNNTDIPQE